MSTYTGDATIVDVFITGASHAGPFSGTTVGYTVPSGVFAEVTIIGISLSTDVSSTASCTIGSYGKSIGPSDSISLVFEDFGTPMIMDEGQTITASTQSDANADVTVAIKEYNKP